MRVKRETPAELVVAEGTIWVSCICAVVASALLYSLRNQGQKLGGLLMAGFLLAFAAGFVLKTQVIFNAMERTASWSGRRLFWVKSGTIPFDAIQDVGMDSSVGNHGVLTYRMTIVTAQGTIPMSDSYSGGKQSKTEMRERILRFLGKEAGSANEADESSIRSLLAQGRKIDAIQLLRSSRNIGLTEAKQQVEAIEAQTETH
ncbi:MAG: hypothetical protein ABSD59_19640 [Terracidiphilus sp.]|jgi:hypothetical protein